jgi:NADPH-dependent curcumin reductase CurA
LAQVAETEKAAVNAEFDRQKQEAAEQLKQALADSVDTFLQSSSETVVRAVETAKKEKEKQTIEDAISIAEAGMRRVMRFICSLHA